MYILRDLIVLFKRESEVTVADRLRPATGSERTGLRWGMDRRRTVHVPIPPGWSSPTSDAGHAKMATDGNCLPEICGFFEDRLPQNGMVCNLKWQRYCVQINVYIYTCVFYLCIYIYILILLAIFPLYSHCFCSIRHFHPLAILFGQGPDHPPITEMRV